MHIAGITGCISPEYLGAERNTRKVDFADFGNSPFEYTPEKVSGREVVFTTTNGTRAIEAAKACKQLFTGAFSNIDSLADACLQASDRVVVLCSGWTNKVNIEDTLFAGALAERLMGKGGATAGSDSVNMALNLWRLAKEDPIEFVKPSDHYKRLITHGAEGDADYCLKMNTVSVVPSYDKQEGKLKLNC